MARIDLYSKEILEKERKRVLKAAKELKYNNDIILKIQTAKTVHELDRIMKDARGK